MIDEEDTREYKVVVNHEEQYSIWLAAKELPLGWNLVTIPDAWIVKHHAEKKLDKQSSSKSICLAYIEEIWTDIRPLSLRKAMVELSQ